tara:strand:+ start:869 stop:1120 length:252 start_codon:yes stop_codon:yes gene_type:complete
VVVETTFSDRYNPRRGKKGFEAIDSFVSGVRVNPGRGPYAFKSVGLTATRDAVFYGSSHIYEPLHTKLPCFFHHFGGTVTIVW